MPGRAEVSLLALLGAVFVVAPAESGSTDFDAGDSLRIVRILEPPKAAPGGSAVAYVAADSRNGAAILAHKPLGRLRVHWPATGAETVLAERASDPVWSPSGRSLAFFEGSGATRELVTATFGDDGPAFRRFPAPGAPPGYSTRQFAPVWTAEERHVIVTAPTAETADGARSEAVAPPAHPYTVSSLTALTPFDAHFRDDTLRRLVRIDLRSGSRRFLTPPIAIRGFTPDPSGQQLLLESACAGKAGYFAGDDYVQPRRYDVVRLSDGRARALKLDPAPDEVHWQTGDTVLARTGERLTVIRLTESRLPESGLTESEPVESFPDIGLAAGASIATGEQSIAAWESLPPKADARPYLIPPPSSHRLRAEAAGSAGSQTLIEPQDGLEVLSALWLNPDSAGLPRLAIHARDLETLVESIRLWDGDGGTLRTAFEGELAIGPLEPVRADMLAFAAESAVAPPELFLLDLRSGETRAISRLNEDFAGRGFVAPWLVEGETERGERWRALLYRPEGRRDNADVPLVVRAYARQTGGRHTFHAEAQMHVARRYAYLLPDVFPVRGALHRAYAEVLPAAIRDVRSRYGLGEKTGYVGGSLGGYAGLVLLTATQAVDAAVLRAPPTEFSMSWATGKDRDADLLEHLMLGDTPHGNAQAYMSSSPFWRADRIRAPTLILHGTDDAQVPVEQSMWAFQTMRRSGTAHAELRLYPGGDHKIVRGSREYYLDFYRQIFGWWNRFLDTEKQ